MNLPLDQLTLLLLSLFPLSDANMEARKTIGNCKFDILFTKCVPHILETILFSLDYESYNTCLKVSTAWRELISSDSCRKKAKSIFHGEIDQDEDKLWQAAKEGNIEKVQSLSSRIFVDVNCVRGLDLSTPLYGAVSAPALHPRYASHKNVIKLQRGAKPNKSNKYEKTPNGDYFIKRSVMKGVLPQILEDLIQARKKVKV